MILSSASLVNSAFAQSAQVSYTVNLNVFTLQVTYPSQVKPGDTISVNVQASPKTSIAYLQNLTATIYYADTSGLHTIATQNLYSNNAYYYGNYATPSFTKSFTVNVPSSAPRTSLVALFTETAQSNYFYTFYNYGSYYYGGYYPAYPFQVYPSYNSGTATDNAIAPLSYVQASTPEYVALQSTYQMLQQQLNQTQAQLRQGQAQNQQLQNTVAQQSATLNQLNQQLATASGMTQTYQLLALALGILAAVLRSSASMNGKSRPRPRTLPELIPSKLKPKKLSIPPTPNSAFCCALNINREDTYRPLTYKPNSILRLNLLLGTDALSKMWLLAILRRDKTNQANSRLR